MIMLMVIKLELRFFDMTETRNSTYHFSPKKSGGGGDGNRLNVYFKSRLKLDLFSKNYIYILKEEIFAPSFYNKNSLLMFFPKY